MDSLYCLMLHPKSRSFVIILSCMLGSLFHCAFLETLQKSHTSKSAFLTMKKWTMPFPSLKRQGGLFKISLVYWLYKKVISCKILFVCLTRFFVRRRITCSWHEGTNPRIHQFTNLKCWKMSLKSKRRLKLFLK